MPQGLKSLRENSTYELSTTGSVSRSLTNDGWDSTDVDR
jgi:hypothetical protein